MIRQYDEMINPPVINRDNNFDLIRLFAALQVVFFHVQNRLNLVIPGIDWLQHLTGVPIFFTVSGFLISASFLRNRNVKRYVINRGLRIYPAIYVLFVMTTLAAMTSGDLTPRDLLSKEFLYWGWTWATNGQNIPPPLLYGFGIGDPNGSLWTIPVELSFYLFIAVILFFIKNLRLLNVVIGMLWIFSVVANHFHYVPNHREYDSVLPPQLFWFLMGTIMYLNWDRLRKYIENKFVILFSIYMILILSNFFFPSIDTHPEMGIKTIRGVLMDILLSVTTISAAFSFRGAARILKGKDLSYGIYLYHGLIINVWIEMSDIRSYWLYIVVYCITILCAWFSWHLVEKPCLELKNLTK